MRGKNAVIAVLALVVATGGAHASIIAGTPIVTFNNGTGNFDWTYGVTLAADEQLGQGSHFTLYDFGPVVGNLPYATTGFLNTSGNITWTQSPNLSSDAAGLVDNNPNVNDVRFTYNGTVVVTGLSMSNGAVNNLGSFTLESKSGSPTAVAYKQGSVAQDLNGLPDNNTASATIPAVPEPASLAIIGSALCGVGLLRRRRA